MKKCKKLQLAAPFRDKKGQKTIQYACILRTIPIVFKQNREESCFGIYIFLTGVNGTGDKLYDENISAYTNKN